MKHCLYVVISVLAGCASAPGALQFQDQPDVQARPDKALVFIFREPDSLMGMVGAGCGFDVKLSDGAVPLGALPCGKYLWFYAAPGKHSFTPAKAMNIGVAYVVDLEAGKRYYLEPISGGLPAGFALDLMPVEERPARHLMAECTSAGVANDP